MFAVWQALTDAFTVLPFAPALAWIVLSAALFAIWHFHPGRPRRLRRLARFRLHPVRGAGWWLGWAAAATFLSAVLLGVAAALTLPRTGSRSVVAEQLARPGGVVLMALRAGLVGPFVEEAFFRGYIQRRLERAIGAPAAVAITALVFAAAHGANPAPVAQLIMGLILGYAAYVTRSLWPAVLVHVVHNSTLIAGYSLLAGRHEPTLPTRGGAAWTAWILAALSGALLVWLLHRAGSAAHSARAGVRPRRPGAISGIGIPGAVAARPTE
ncbi:MAG: CPBP family intramembrane metalloprotease [Gemmatimonadetes bacterium]|nr:CPBP family intramembrane metalloprotease [Gemmatimonadota bacterium]